MSFRKALNRFVWGASLGASGYFGYLSLRVSQISHFDHGRPMNVAVAVIFAVASFAGVWIAYGILYVTVIRPLIWLLAIGRGVRDVKVNCPKCGQRLHGATADMVGDIGVCPKCNAEFPITEDQTGHA